MDEKVKKGGGCTLLFCTRLDQCLEPAIADKGGEVIVHVHAAASLKPVDKQLARGSRYASQRELPCDPLTRSLPHR